MLGRDAAAAEDLGTRIPAPLPQDPDTDLQQWLSELQVEADDVDAALDAVLDSLQVPHASGRALDELGKDAGILGQRRGRPDDQYRAFLLGLVAAFDGRGTPPGLRLAIAVGVLADQADISLIEDFDAQEYEVELFDWAPHRTGTVHELADLADPSVVQRRDPLYYILDEAAIQYDTASTVVAPMTTLAKATVRYAVSDTQTATLDSSGTFGTGRFDGKDTFS